MQRSVSLCVPLAAFVCAAALAGFGAAFAVYSHLEHPVGALGAAQVPRAAAFNLLAFVVPGLLAAAASIGVRGQLSGTSWAARVGAQALLLSALAFAAQGVFPLDLEDIDGARSRLHASAWTAWWLASGVAGLLMGPGLRRGRDPRRGRGISIATGAVLLLALAGPLVLPPGLSQRMAFAGWFLALWIAARQP